MACRYLFFLSLLLWNGVCRATSTVSVSGRVTSAKGEPLESSTVSHAASGLWALTDAKGDFTLRGLPSGNVELEVRIVGYRTQTVRLNLAADTTGESRLAATAGGPLIDIVTTLIGITVGASTQADVFLTGRSVLIFGLGLASFVIATTFGVGFVKFMNLFLSEEKKINPLIGNAGVSAVPDAARVSETVGLEADPSNHLLMHAMAPNVAGVIGSAVAAGILLSFLG